MKNLSVVVTKIGGPEVVRVVQDYRPEPGPGEVRLAVKVAGVSQAEITIREGMYPQTAPPPFVLGYDAIGTVEKPGLGVTEFKLGDTVAAITVRGSHTRYPCWKASELTAVPKGVDPVKAVCLILNYTTAYQMLHRVAKVQKGERILVHSAAGGVR